MENSYLAPTLPQTLPDDPMHWVQAWLESATEGSVQRNPNAMTLATIGADGAPAARVVLCKAFVADPGYVVFYTNYGSPKLARLDSSMDVAITFHWDALGRQARLQGPAVRSPADESDRYFSTRDRGSQLGAWGSDQSQPIASRAALMAQVRERARRFGVDLSDDLQTELQSGRPEIPRPPHWGGIRVWPARVELWIEGADRIHDRAAWTRRLDRAGDHDFTPGRWSGTRLQP